MDKDDIDINLQIEGTYKEKQNPNLIPPDYSKPSQKNQKQESSCFKFLTPEFYQPYFDVTQTQVTERIVSSITIREGFLELIQKNPDLYGPIWIMATIVFLLSSMGNLTRYFVHVNKFNQQGTADQFLMRISYVRIGFVVVFGFGIGVPLLLAFLMKFYGSKITVVQVLCLYGYSLSVFLIVLILCVIPLNWLQWIFISIGIVISTLFLLRSLRNEIQQYQNQTKYIIYVIIGIAQIALFFVFKLKFFDLTTSNKSSGSGSESSGSGSGSGSGSQP